MRAQCKADGRVVYDLGCAEQHLFARVSLGGLPLERDPVTVPACLICGGLNAKIFAEKRAILGTVFQLYPDVPS